ncbi:T9SS type A sorting domain-containing protein [Hymenobacter gummosus]|uniref:T9SS type A sorting domain-containing protein n=1 Tax=Hymenobacter gummosus TaxID=1776032 RepID=A0A3S0JCQ9_9BACT|nr:T9SS type A sorting domain-containing protein [Hymenobacter gummosus]RTQ44899.1 T9SS type A sorting domain-containing protein [Hymenobacter gummosus]
MKYQLRLPFLVCSLLLSLGYSPLVRAQQAAVQPLLADPGRARQGRPAAALRGNATTLTLPFFEDFAGQREGGPSPDRWQGGQVLINERFAQAPPSRGVATFDGFDALGRPYAAISTYGPTDSLTSHAIDLSGRNPADSVLLSFFWQAGTIVRSPSSNLSSRRVGIQLEFLSNTGTWDKVWEALSTGVRTPFQQKFVAVDQAKYLHAGFRFRFSTSGSRSGTFDAWNLDYILLDRGRSARRVSYSDVVLSAPLTSLLKRYSAMPPWQFNAAPNPTLELNDSTFTTFNNLDLGTPPVPFSWRGVVRTLPGGAERQFVVGDTILNAGTRQFPIRGSVRNTPLTISGSTRVQHSIYLNLLTSGDLRKAPNDTVRRTTEFSDYFAYDDGSAEGTTSINPNSNAATSRAVRFNLNRPDQVTSLRVYYAGTTAVGVPVPATISVTFSVWDVGADGLPAAQPKATKTLTLPTTVDSTRWRVITFDQPVPVSGSFFIGYTQPATSFLIRFGLDLNTQQPRQTFYDRDASAPWLPVVTGSPLMRPVMNGVVTSTRSSAAEAAVRLYPNPSSGLVQVQGRYLGATALDALGRTVWQQPAADAGKAQLDLRQLPAGVYLLRLTLPGGLVSTQRLVLQP